jgi:hypothetical protein
VLCEPQVIPFDIAAATAGVKALLSTQFGRCRVRCSLAALLMGPAIEGLPNLPLTMVFGCIMIVVLMVVDVNGCDV